MGADVIHPAPGSEGRPSFTSVVGNVDSTTAKYIATTRVQVNIWSFSHPFSLLIVINQIRRRDKRWSMTWKRWQGLVWSRLLANNVPDWLNSLAYHWHVLQISKEQREENQLWTKANNLLSRYISERRSSFSLLMFLLVRWRVRGAVPTGYRTRYFPFEFLGRLCHSWQQF